MYGWPEPYIYTHIRCMYGIFCRNVTKYTVIYGVYIRFWPTLQICYTLLADASDYGTRTSEHEPLTCTHTHMYTHTHTHLMHTLNAHAHAHAHTHTHTPTHTHTHTQTSTHSLTRAHTCATRTLATAPNPVGIPLSASSCAATPTLLASLAPQI